MAGRLVWGLGADTGGTESGGGGRRLRRFLSALDLNHTETLSDGTRPAGPTTVLVIVKPSRMVIDSAENSAEPNSHPCGAVGKVYP